MVLVLALKINHVSFINPGKHKQNKEILISGDGEAVKFQGGFALPDLGTKTLLRSFPLRSGDVSINNDLAVAKRRCNCYNLYNKLIPYADAWKWQKTVVDKHTTAKENGVDVDDAVIILQHPPVYTLGTHSSEDNILFDKEQPPCDLYRTERGGEVTYHGPGQLVMYPILNLRYHQMDLHWYLRSLEEVVIRALWSACMIEGRRIKGLTGVWVGDKKVAAIGIRVSRWISYHGLALNVTTDLAPFQRIVPCGISNRPVGSVLGFLEDPSFIQSSEQETSDSLLNLVHTKLLEEFSEVFRLDLFTTPADSLIASELCEVEL